MNEEEEAYYQAQQDEYLSECGNCPSCGKATHISDLGRNKDGRIDCVYCHDSLDEVLEPDTNDTSQFPVEGNDLPMF